MRRLSLFLLALCLGAVAYSLVRSEGGSERSPRADSGSAAGEPGTRRCAGVTRSGRRCSREAEPGSEHCWQHGGS